MIVEGLLLSDGLFRRGAAGMESRVGLDLTNDAGEGSGARRALIAGMGYVGGVLAELLQGNGDAVWGLRRGPAVPSGSAAYHAVAADLTDAVALAAALAPFCDGDAGIDLYYLASADAYDDEAYRRAYVTGFSMLLEVLERAPLRRVLFASSSAVYGQADGSWVDETSDTAPQSFAGRRLLEAEALLGPVRARGIGATALRFGGIYGPGRTRLIDRIRQGYAIAEPSRPQYRSRMHRDDCAAALAHVARLERPAPVYVAVDDSPADMREVEAWLCAELGVSVEILKPLAGPSPRAANRRCRNTLLRDSGLVLAHRSYREGYGALLADGA